MTRRSLVGRTLLSATALTSALYANAAYAQPEALASAEAAAGATEAAEIVVTGTRRSVSLQDAPINISAISSAQIEEKGITDIRDLAAFTPGVTVLDTGARSASKIVLRGLSANDTGTGGSNSENAVATYLGEVPLYLDFKLLDIDRVETLLGPQGTLYGMGTLAGAIRYMPKRPNTNEVEGYFHVRGTTVAHSDDLGYNIDAAVNVPISQDHVALRSVVGYFFDPGFIDYNYVLKTPGISLAPAGTAFARHACAAGSQFRSAQGCELRADAHHAQHAAPANLGRLQGVRHLRLSVDQDGRLSGEQRGRARHGQI